MIPGDFPQFHRQAFLCDFATFASLREIVAQEAAQNKTCPVARAVKKPISAARPDTSLVRRVQPPKCPDRIGNPRAETSDGP